MAYHSNHWSFRCVIIKVYKKHYDLSEKKDIENLLYLQPIMSKYKDEFVEDYYEALSAKFKLTDKQAGALGANKEKLGEWYDRLFFDGNPNNSYFNFFI